MIKTNLWEYGFFEDFVIYKCGFWDYDKVNNHEEQVSITIAKGNERLELQYISINESQIQIKSEDREPENFSF